MSDSLMLGPKGKKLDHIEFAKNDSGGSLLISNNKERRAVLITVAVTGRITVEEMTAQTGI